MFLKIKYTFFCLRLEVFQEIKETKSPLFHRKLQCTLHRLINNNLKVTTNTVAQRETENSYNVKDTSKDPNLTTLKKKKKKSKYTYIKRQGRIVSFSIFNIVCFLKLPSYTLYRLQYLQCQILPALIYIFPLNKPLRSNQSKRNAEVTFSKITDTCLQPLLMRIPIKESNQNCFKMPSL